MDKRRSKLLAILVAGVSVVVLLGAIVALPGYIDRRVKDARHGPLHVFHLGAAPPFLTDALALEKARQTLALDGYDLSAWQPVGDDRSSAPDKTPDRYFSRNTLDANQGSVLFANRADPNPRRIVSIQLKGDRVECRVVVPK